MAEWRSPRSPSPPATIAVDVEAMRALIANAPPSAKCRLAESSSSPPWSIPKLAQKHGARVSSPGGQAVSAPLYGRAPLRPPNRGVSGPPNHRCRTLLG